MQLYIDNTVVITWHQYQCQWTTNSCYTLFQVCWPKKSIGAIDNTVGIIWHYLQCKGCHMTKEVMFALDFNHLDLRNVMVPWMTPSASHDTDANTTGITWPKKSCCTSFHLSNLRNAVVPLMMHQCQWHQINNMPCCTSFQFSWHKKGSGTTENVISISTFQCRTQRCHMTQKECSDFIDGVVQVTWYWHQCSGITWHQHQC